MIWNYHWDPDQMNSGEPYYSSLIRILVFFVFLESLPVRGQNIDVVSEDVVSLSDITYNLRSGIGVTDNVLYSNNNVDTQSTSYNTNFKQSICILSHTLCSITSAHITTIPHDDIVTPTWRHL